MKLQDYAHRLCCGIAASMTVLLAASAASAQTVEEFYKDQIVTVTWAGEEGGSYDAYARIFAKHMSRFIPGHPTLIMRYMPGGGGLRYANYVPVSEPADGLYIGIMNYSTFPYRYLFPDQANYDPASFSHIGSMGVVNTVISALRDKAEEKGVQNVYDVENTEIIMSATGRGSQSYQDVAVVNKLIGAKFKIISGYPGAAQAVLAVERGEVDGFAITWDGWNTRRQDWLAENKLLHFVQFGEPRIPGLDDVPLVNTLAQTDLDKAAVDYITAALEIGRPFFAPPGVPADRLAALRSAFDQMVKDPEYIADMEARHFPATTFTSGERQEEIIAKMGQATPEVLERARDLIN